MKLNKRRVKMLVGIIVGVLLLVGTCIRSIINSVDYEKAEEDIDVICAARVQSYRLMGEHVKFANACAIGEELNTDSVVEEIKISNEYKEQLAEVDLDNLKGYCENENYDYEFYLISYNQILRTYCYCEHGLDKLKENPFGGAFEFAMLKTIVTRDYWTDELRDNAEAYDKEFGFVEYK